MANTVAKGAAQAQPVAGTGPLFLSPQILTLLSGAELGGNGSFPWRLRLAFPALADNPVVVSFEGSQPDFLLDRIYIWTSIQEIRARDMEKLGPYLMVNP